MRQDLERRLAQRRDRRARWRRLLSFLLPALLLHLFLGVVAQGLLPHLRGRVSDAKPPMRLVIVQPPRPEELEEPDPEDEQEPEFRGQIVELPEPEEKKRPDEAEYLAEHDVTVEKETRTEQVAVNPEVLAPEFSEEQQAQQDAVADAEVETPADGAVTGQDAKKPEVDKGNRPKLPSPWNMTNKEGDTAPAAASSADSKASGAPQNDLLNEQLDDKVALNAKEYLYASYLNRIRRLVNFYWQQNIDNLPSSVQIVKTAYVTGVEVVLDGNGALEVIEVVKASGSGELDDCVIRAFRLAGPFPNPPEGLIEKDGRVYLPHFDFTVRAGQATLNYRGVDPRAGVQFPGLMKSPR